MSAPGPLPTFFLVGAPKAGTTSLYHYLDQHPEVFMCPIKEPCHFSSEVRPENFAEEIRPRAEAALRDLARYLEGPMTQKLPGSMVMDWESYVRLFRNAGDRKTIGEASVNYLWSKSAPGNIAARIPDAKILMVLRNPVDRAYSQYLDTVTGGLTRCSFRESVDRSLRHTTGLLCVDHPFLEFGLYCDQVKRYFSIFPRANISIHLYEEYQARPAGVLAEVFRFLGVDPEAPVDLSHKHHQPRVPKLVAPSYFLKKSGLWRLARRLTPESLLPLFRRSAIQPRRNLVMDPRDRAYLAGYYREDVCGLSSLLNRDLTAWCAPNPTTDTRTGR